MSIEGLKIAREIMQQPALKPYVHGRAAARARTYDTDAELFDYGCANAKTDHHPGRHLQDGARIATRSSGWT